MSEIFERELIANFFCQFIELEQKNITEKITAFKEEVRGFDTFFTNFKPVDTKLQTILATTAPDYNVFEILNIRHYETKVHTPFLAHLLDPKASHKQGSIFFDRFIDLLFGKGYASAISEIQIFEEFCCNSRGRIDILVLYKVGIQKKALVIENKIYHHDEENQLLRYYQYLTQDLRLATGNYHLVYLTPHKTAPSDFSISKQEYTNLKKDNSLTELGYHQDIVPWLENTLEFIKASNVKETILQYIKTIKTL